MRRRHLCPTGNRLTKSRGGAEEARRRKSEEEGGEEGRKTWARDEDDEKKNKERGRGDGIQWKPTKLKFSRYKKKDTMKLLNIEGQFVYFALCCIFQMLQTQGNS